MCFDVCHAIFTEVYAMQTRLRDVSDFRDLVILPSVTAVILLPCIHVSTERPMLILGMFSKDVL